MGRWVTVYIDFFGVLSITDVTGRIDDAYAEHLTGTLGAWFLGLRRSLKPDTRLGVRGASVGATADLSQDNSLLQPLGLPFKVAARSRLRVLADSTSSNRSSPSGTTSTQSTGPGYRITKGQLCLCWIAGVSAQRALHGSAAGVLRPGSSPGDWTPPGRRTPPPPTKPPLV